MIDTALPRSNKTDIPMHAVLSTQQQPLTAPTTASELPLSLYVALIEKAYLTIMSPTGYAYRGSTPALDLSLLTGWIPEHISLTAPGFRRESTWDAIWSAWRDGRVLLCAGTGRARSSAVARQGSGRQRRRSSSSSRARRTLASDHNGAAMAEGLGRGLVPLHAYGIIDMWDDVPGVKPRGVIISNPWRQRGQVASGPSEGMQMSEIATVLEEEENEDQAEAEQTSRELPDDVAHH